MSAWLEDDGLNESQPAGSIPDFDADLLTVEDLGGETHVEADSPTCAEQVL
jgi:hypothetical protein